MGRNINRRKIIKLFPKENIVLNKNFNNRKPDIWFKDYNIIAEDYDADNEKKREDMFKEHNFKISHCNPNDLNFDLFKFLGEINLYVSKLRERNSVTEVINTITKDLKK